MSLTGYNAELSDRPFAVKRELEGGFARSPLWLNASLARVEKWDEAAINARAELLADRALEVWPRPPIDAATLQRYREARGVARATYTLADHGHLVGPVLDLYMDLRRRVLNLDPELREDVRKQYIGFRGSSTIVSVVPLSGELKLYLRGRVEELDDPENRLRDVTRVGHWGVGDVEVRAARPTDLEPVMALIEQAHARHRDDPETEAAWAEAAVERVIEAFPDESMQGALRRLVEAASESACTPALNKQALMFAPTANRSRMLCTFFRRDDADADFYVAPDAFADFGIDTTTVTAQLGDGSAAARVGAGQVARIGDALEELLADVETVDAPQWRERHALRQNRTELLEQARERTPLESRWWGQRDTTGWARARADLASRITTP